MFKNCSPNTHSFAFRSHLPPAHPPKKNKEKVLLRFSAIKYVIVTSSEVWDSWARRLQLLCGDRADASAGTGEILARCGSVLGRSRCRRPGGRWTAAPRGLRREGAAGWGQRILVRNHSSLVHTLGRGEKAASAPGPIARTTAAQSPNATLLPPPVRGLGSKRLDEHGRVRSCFHRPARENRPKAELRFCSRGNPAQAGG